MHRRNFLHGDQCERRFSSSMRLTKSWNGNGGADSPGNPRQKNPRRRRISGARSNQESVAISQPTDHQQTKIPPALQPASQRLAETKGPARLQAATRKGRRGREVYSRPPRTVSVLPFSLIIHISTPPIQTSPQSYFSNLTTKTKVSSESPGTPGR